MFNRLNKLKFNRKLSLRFPSTIYVILFDNNYKIFNKWCSSGKSICVLKFSLYSRLCLRLILDLIRHIQNTLFSASFVSGILFVCLELSRSARPSFITNKSEAQQYFVILACTSRKFTCVFQIIAVLLAIVKNLMSVGFIHPQLIDFMQG